METVFNEGLPAVTGVYMVNRGMQGVWLRHFDAETGDWSRCAPDFDSLDINAKTCVGDFPWAGPVKRKAVAVDALVTAVEGSGDAPEAPKVVKDKKPKRAPGTTGGRGRKASPAGMKAATLPDGSIFHVKDKGYWVAVKDGRIAQYRDTAEAMAKWFKKKFPGIDTKVVD